jgi:ABC-2 type transport system ATP-binding protein
VDYAGFFGAALHVSGRNRAALENALVHFRDQQDVRVSETPPNLEDVFIQLQESAK